MYNFVKFRKFRQDGAYLFINDRVHNKIIHLICASDAGWSDWGQWSSCSVTCGLGTLTRHRSCETLSSTTDEKPCEGSKLQIKRCLSSQPCTDDGGWLNWSRWSSCSVTCGLGTLTRHRSCKIQHCKGTKMQTKRCSQPCAEKKCKNPPEVPNASYALYSRRNNSLSMGTTATYTCDPGYEFKNSSDSVLTCTLNLEIDTLEWRGEMPKCLEFKCGLRSGKTKGHGKVVGGHPATDPWPWMAAIYMTRKGFPPEYHCGGSVIHEKFILTAAHCLYRRDNTKRDEKDILVKLGLTDVRKESSLQKCEVEKIIFHPDFHSGRVFDYDIALLQLKTPIMFNSLIRPICLPPRELPNDTDFYKPGEYLGAIGWGITRVVHIMEEVPYVPPEQLKEIFLPFQSSQTCRRNSLLPNNAFTDRMFCAGDGRGGNDTCLGDSGGPAMQSKLNEDGYTYWTQVGIVSWGLGCGLRKTYGYYTHVQNLVDWVTSNIPPIKAQVNH